MAIPITIPRLGWNMEEGTFAGWLKHDGETVRAGEAIFSLESEKATEQIECLDSGTLRIAPNAPKTGDIVAVGVVIGYLVQKGEAFPEESGRVAVTLPPSPPALLNSGRPVGKNTAALETLPTAMTPSPPAVHESPAAGTSAKEGDSKMASKAISPRARRAAAQLGVDWTGLQGTGRTGRIRERDVRAAAPADRGASRVAPMRKTIAERMLFSLRETAPVTLTSTVDASNLVNLRNQFKAAGQAVPAYTDFLVKLCASALRQHPALNSRWDGPEIVVEPAIHIGIAVDTEAGLVAPVIRDAAMLGVKQIAARSRDLIERARGRRLAAEQMQGGTFTITNLGAFGVDAFTPIINYPQCAILGVGRIQKQPVAVEDRIDIREQLALSLTFDHRIVDGAPAARFLQTLAGMIQNPGPWLLKE